jgi:hypothetical protein
MVMQVRRPSSTDSKIIKNILKKNTVTDLTMEKFRWHLVINIKSNKNLLKIVTILSGLGYDLDNKTCNVIYVYIPKLKKYET